MSTKKVAVKRKVGRPSKKTDDLIAEICGRLACGEPMSRISQDAHMPDMKNVYAWLKKDPEFRHQYEEARKDGAHTFADQIAQIIDQTPLKLTDEQGNVKYDPASIQWNRLRMDGRKWLAAKYLPKVYGERLGLEGTDGPPVKTEDAGSQRLFELIRTLEMKARAG